jgi:hypothetical protein
MKHKFLNAALILTSVIAYLEWGQHNSTFLLTAEADIIKKLFTSPSTVLHPFTLIPLTGQLLLLATLFQKQPRKTLTYIGMCSIGLLLLFIFIIGIISLNVKIAASALPFIITAILTTMANKTKYKAWPQPNAVAQPDSQKLF